MSTGPRTIQINIQKTGDRYAMVIQKLATMENLMSACESFDPGQLIQIPN